MAYDQAFYDAIREGCRRSAAVVVPLVLEHYQPRTVVDVGCGEGHWGAAFRDEGCEALGIDGEYANPVIPWASADLEGCDLMHRYLAADGDPDAMRALIAERQAVA